MGGVVEVNAERYAQLEEEFEYAKALRDERDALRKQNAQLVKRIARLTAELEACHDQIGGLRRDDINSLAAPSGS